MVSRKFYRFASSAGQKDVQTKRPLVLVIDDDKGILDALQLNLQGTYQVRLAASGKEGLLQLDSDVCAVILDIKMPEQDGLQVYEEIKRRLPDLPVIFYSAYQDVLEATKLDLKYKPFSYYEKGKSVQGLLEVLERAVAHYIRIQYLLSTVQRLQKISGKG